MCVHSLKRAHKLQAKLWFDNCLEQLLDEKAGRIIEQPQVSCKFVSSLLGQCPECLRLKLSDVSELEIFANLSYQGRQMRCMDLMVMSIEKG